MCIIFSIIYNATVSERPVLFAQDESTMYCVEELTRHIPAKQCLFLFGIGNDLWSSFYNRYMRPINWRSIRQTCLLMLLCYSFYGRGHSIWSQQLINIGLHKPLTVAVHTWSALYDYFAGLESVVLYFSCSRLSQRLAYLYDVGSAQGLSLQIVVKCHIGVYASRSLLGLKTEKMFWNEIYQEIDTYCSHVHVQCLMYNVRRKQA